MPPDLNNQNQFTSHKEVNFKKPPVYIVILIIFAALLGAFQIGAMYLRKNTQSSLEQNLVATDPTADWKTYRNEEFGFEFKYPNEWKNFEYEGYFINSEGRTVLQYDILKSSVNKSIAEISANRVNENHCPGDRVILSDDKGSMFVLYCSISSEGYYYLTRLNADNVIEFYYHDDFHSDWPEDKKISRLNQIISTFKFISTSTEEVSWDSENQANFEGYYTKTERNVWGSTAICDSFVVTNTNYLVDYYKNMVRSGNSINTINDKGNLVINLELSNVNPDIVQKIKSSNENEKVFIKVKKKVEQAKGAPQCFSFFNIVE